MNEGQLPPQNQQAEQSVLGSMLRDNGVIGDVLQLLRVDDFYADAHQKIAQAMFDLFAKVKPVDLVTVVNVLHERKQVDDVGGYSYLATLWDAAPTAANAEHYAGIVREQAILRNLMRAGATIQHEAANPTGPADEVLEAAERTIFAIAEVGYQGSSVMLDKAVGEAYDLIDARSTDQGAACGIKTGFSDLDAILGGLRESELTVLAARTAIGKTALALNIAHNVAVNGGEPVFFASLEQTRAELAERLLYMRSGVSGTKGRKGYLSKEEYAQIMEAGAQLKAAKFEIDDTPGQTMLRIIANARRQKLRRGLKLVVVDYLQLIQPENPKAPRQEQVAAMSRKLKLLAREVKVHVIALAQLNRGAEDRARPRLSDLRESGAIEQDADTVILLSESEHPNVVIADVAKQRNGPTRDASLFFRKECTRFEDLRLEHHAQEA